MRLDCSPPTGTRGADRGDRGTLRHTERGRKGEGDVDPVAFTALGGREGRKAEPDRDRRSAPCACRDLQGAVAALSRGEEARHDRHALPPEPQGIHGFV